VKRSLANFIEELKRAEKRSKNSFVKLDSNFYKEVINELEELQVRAREYFDEGNLEKVGEITDELNRAKKAFEDLVDLRIRKLLRGVVSPTLKTKNMTKKEMQLYSDIKTLISEFRDSVIHGAAPHKSEVIVEEPAVIEQAPVEEDKFAPKNNVNEERYVLVRVIAPKVRVVLPTGKILALRKEDVLHVPEKVYNILIKRDKVEKIKLS